MLLLGAGMLNAAGPEVTDVSSGGYAQVHARRLIASRDKDGNGTIEKAELDRQWRSLGRWDADKDESLSLAELVKSEIPYLDSRGAQQRNILYKRTTEEDLYLDLYYPEERGASKLPVVVYLHGGGWATGSKQHIAVGAFSDVYLKLLESGFAVAAVNYRLCKAGGSVAVRDCVTDVKDGVRYLSQHSGALGLDLERCVVHGDSAGGHLAQMLLLSPGSDLPGDPALVEFRYRMIAGVSWYGPCDFQQIELFDSGGGGAVRDRFGGRIVKPGTDPKDAPRLYREISPVTYLSADSPPLLMIQGDKDTAIPAKHAFHMREKAAGGRAPVEIMIVKNAGHNWREVGGAIEPGIDEIVARTVQFMVDRVAAPP